MVIAPDANGSRRWLGWAPRVFGGARGLAGAGALASATGWGRWASTMSADLERAGGRVGRPRPGRRLGVVRGRAPPATGWGTWPSRTKGWSSRVQVCVPFPQSRVRLCVVGILRPPPPSVPFGLGLSRSRIRVERNETLGRFQDSCVKTPDLDCRPARVRVGGATHHLGWPRQEFSTLLPHQYRKVYCSRSMSMDQKYSAAFWGLNRPGESKIAMPARSHMVYPSFSACRVALQLLSFPESLAK